MTSSTAQRNLESYTQRYMGDAVLPPAATNRWGATAGSCTKSQCPRQRAAGPAAPPDRRALASAARPRRGSSSSASDWLRALSPGGCAPGLSSCSTCTTCCVKTLQHTQALRQPRQMDSVAAAHHQVVSCAQVVQNLTKQATHACDCSLSNIS